MSFYPVSDLSQAQGKNDHSTIVLTHRKKLMHHPLLVVELGKYSLL